MTEDDGRLAAAAAGRAIEEKRREERRSESLRANLQRRKAQIRARGADDTLISEPSPSTDLDQKAMATSRPTSE